MRTASPKPNYEKEYDNDKYQSDNERCSRDLGTGHTFSDDSLLRIAW